MVGRDELGSTLENSTFYITRASIQAGSNYERRFYYRKSKKKKNRNNTKWGQGLTTMSKNSSDCLNLVLAPNPPPLSHPASSLPFKT